MVGTDGNATENGARIAGLAALGMTASVIFNIVPILVAGALGVRPPSGADFASQVAGILSYPAIYASFGLVFVFLGMSVIALALALHEVLNGSSGFALRIATTAGVIGGALVLLNGFGPVAIGPDLGSIDAKDHQAAAAAYAANVLVTGRLITAGFTMFAMFAFIVSMLAVRAKLMSRPLMLMGVLLAVSMLSNHWLPGPLQLLPVVLTFVWSVWLGISLLRAGSSARRSPARMSTAQI